MDNVMIQYQGFRPTAYTQSYIESRLTEIVHYAPQGAIVRAIFTRKEKIFGARIYVFSTGRKFFAATSGRYMRVAARNIGAQVIRQMQRWKKLQRRVRGLHDMGLA